MSIRPYVLPGDSFTLSGDPTASAPAESMLRRAGRLARHAARMAACVALAVALSCLALHLDSHPMREGTLTPPRGGMVHSPERAALPPHLAGADRDGGGPKHVK